MKEVLEHDHAFYTLCRDDETNDYVLEVECGTTAVFTVAIKLKPGEIARYQVEPGSIRILAYRVLDNPDEFIARKI